MQIRLFPLLQNIPAKSSAPCIPSEARFLPRSLRSAGRPSNRFPPKTDRPSHRTPPGKYHVQLFVQKKISVKMLPVLPRSCENPGPGFPYFFRFPQNDFSFFHYHPIQPSDTHIPLHTPHVPGSYTDTTEKTQYNCPFSHLPSPGCSAAPAGIPSHCAAYTGSSHPSPPAEDAAPAETGTSHRPYSPPPDPTEASGNTGAAEALPRKRPPLSPATGTAPDFQSD